ncbi:MAG: beta-glucosidase BglX [Bacteroidales bacterium]
MRMANKVLKRGGRTSMMFLTGFLSLTICLSCCQKEKTDTSFSGDARIGYKVDSLLSLMTLEEKIGQMNQYAGNDNLTGPFIDENIDSLLSQGLIGSILNVTDIGKMRKMQEQNLKGSRLNIPLIFAYDVVHGYKTIFPIPLAGACSWNPDLMEKMAAVSAREAAAAGISWTFAPMVDIARDPRWGRVMEGAGEDPYLGSVLAKAQIIGYQGVNASDLKSDDKIMACAKHFCGYGASEAGRDYNTVDLSKHVLENIYFPPFEACNEAGVASFMTAFNDLSGVPCSANQYLLKETLRDKWQFNGVVVSDYQAIKELIAHGVAADVREASLKAIQAQVDVDMTDGCYVESYESLIADNLISEADIDRSVRRILEMKFLLGLFDDPYKYLYDDQSETKIGTEENKQAALELAKESIVLLKNDGGLLPVEKDRSMKIALIGPMIKDRINQSGEWIAQGNRDSCISIYDAFVDKYSETPVKWSYAKGCDLNRRDQGLLQEAIVQARNSDLILLALGEDHNNVGEAASMTSIQLTDPQRELLRELRKLNKKIALVVINGRPLDLSLESENTDAIVNAWFLGTMSGEAIVEVISGDHNPSGKLVMSFPRNLGQVPVYYNCKNTGRPLDETNQNPDYCSFYRDSKNTPLYPFGYGLSYTDFVIEGIRADKTTFNENDSVMISCEVTNSGKHAGAEVVQLYIQDIVASIARPIKELKGFEKVYLNPGETQSIQFRISKDDLSFYNINHEKIVEKGDFNIWVGSSSQDISNHLKITLN